MTVRVQLHVVDHLHDDIEIIQDSFDSGNMTAYNKELGDWYNTWVTEDENGATLHWSKYSFEEHLRALESTPSYLLDYESSERAPWVIGIEKFISRDKFTLITRRLIHDITEQLEQEETYADPLERHQIGMFLVRHLESYAFLVSW